MYLVSFFTWTIYYKLYMFITDFPLQINSLISMFVYLINRVCMLE